MENIDIKDFGQGQRSSAALGYLPPSASRLMRGCYPDADRSVLRKMGGNRNALTGLANVATVFRYKTSTREDWIYVNFTGGNGNVVNATLGSSIYTWANAGYVFPTDYQFAIFQHQDRLYFQDPKGHLWVWWDGINGTNQAERANWTPPTTPGVAIAGAGNIDVSNHTVLYAEWAITYNLSSGVETSMSGISARLTPVDESVDVSVPWDLSVGAPQQLSANIYRRGGELSDFYFVGTVANPGGGAPVTVFNDNVADADASTVRVAPRNNGIAPVGLKGHIMHRGRAWAFKESTLYFSAVSMPGVWGAFQDGRATEGGYLTFDGATGDPILALEVEGDVLVTGRQRSVWSLYGETFDQFRPVRRSRVGIKNKNCLVTAYQTCYFIGADNRVYRLANADPEWISEGVQRELSASMTANVEMGFGYNSVIINVPSVRTLMFRPQDSAWNEGAPLVSAGYGIRHSLRPYSGEEVDGPVYIAAASNAIVIPYGDTTIPSEVVWRSGEFMASNYGGQHNHGRTQVEFIAVHGDIEIDMADAARAKLKVYTWDTVNGVLTTYVRTYDIVTGAGIQTRSGLICGFRPELDLAGRFAAVAIEGNVRNMSIDFVNVGLTFIGGV